MMLPNIPKTTPTRGGDVLTWARDAQQAFRDIRSAFGSILPTRPRAVEESTAGSARPHPWQIKVSKNESGDLTAEITPGIIFDITDQNSPTAHSAPPSAGLTDPLTAGNHDISVLVLLTDDAAVSSAEIIIYEQGTPPEQTEPHILYPIGSVEIIEEGEALKVETITQKLASYIWYPVFLPWAKHTPADKKLEIGGDPAPDEPPPDDEIAIPAVLEHLDIRAGDSVNTGTIEVTTDHDENSNIAPQIKITNSDGDSIEINARDLEDAPGIQLLTEISSVSIVPGGDDQNEAIQVSGQNNRVGTMGSAGFAASDAEKSISIILGDLDTDHSALSIRDVTKINDDDETEVVAKVVSTADIPLGKKFELLWAEYDELNDDLVVGTTEGPVDKVTFALGTSSTVVLEKGGSGQAKATFTGPDSSLEIECGEYATITAGSTQINTDEGAVVVRSGPDIAAALTGESLTLNAQETDKITIDSADIPTGKGEVKLREIDVCVNGEPKKRLFLVSEPYGPPA